MRYTSQYDALVWIIHASDSYAASTTDEKTQIDEWMSRGDVKEYFSNKIVPELSLHESLVLGFVDSDAFQKRIPEEREKIISYLNSAKFKHFADTLERRISSP